LFSDKRLAETSTLIFLARSLAYARARKHSYSHNFLVFTLSLSLSIPPTFPEKYTMRRNTYEDSATRPSIHDKIEQAGGGDWRNGKTVRKRKEKFSSNLLLVGHEHILHAHSSTIIRREEDEREREKQNAECAVCSFFSSSSSSSPVDSLDDDVQDSSSFYFFCSLLLAIYLSSAT
jgi:hypothetical protein